MSRRTYLALMSITKTDDDHDYRADLDDNWLSCSGDEKAVLGLAQSMMGADENGDPNELSLVITWSLASGVSYLHVPGGPAYLLAAALQSTCRWMLDQKLLSSIDRTITEWAYEEYWMGRYGEHSPDYKDKLARNTERTVKDV